MPATKTVWYDKSSLHGNEKEKNQKAVAVVINPPAHRSKAKQNPAAQRKLMKPVQQLL